LLPMSYVITLGEEALTILIRHENIENGNPTFRSDAITNVV